MSYRVSIKGTDYSFLCQQGESLLDEGLRSGLPLDYGCTAGSCGDCRARLVSGSLALLGRAEFPISEADRTAGWFLPCVHSASSDIELEIPDLLLGGEVPEQHIETRVSKLEPAGDDVMIVHLRTPRSASLRFLAGQRVAVTLQGLHRREFSVASCPCNGRVIQIHQCRIPGDPLSDAIFETCRVGDRVQVDGPFGKFRFDDGAIDRPHLFVVYGTGFAAVRSLVEHGLGLEMTAPMHLLWFGFGDDGHYLENVCRAWRDAFDNFSFESIRIDESASPHCSLGHRVTTEYFARQLQPRIVDWRQSGGRVYVSGTAELIAAANGLFRDEEPSANLL